MISLDNDEIIHLLGYLTTEQWDDALSMEDMDKEMIWKLVDAVDSYYNSDFRGEIERFKKERVINRLTK